MQKLIPDASYSSQVISRGSFSIVNVTLVTKNSKSVHARVDRDDRRSTYDICILDELLTTFLLLTNAGGANAEADAKKSAEATAVNFILINTFWVMELQTKRELKEKILWLSFFHAGSR